MRHQGLKIQVSTFKFKKFRCNHKNLTDHLVIFSCETPYCRATETHCRDCGAFLISCGCGYNDGIEGWSRKRFRQLMEKQSKSFKNGRFPERS